MGYIYKVTNKVNGKIYIGQTTCSTEERWKHHIYNANSGVSQYQLYQAMRKYGIESFMVETLEEISNQHLDERECYWIKFFDSYKRGYNMTEGGSGVKIRTEDFYKEIADLKRQGKTYEEICQLKHCCRETVLDALNSQDMVNHQFSKDEEIIRLRQMGKTYNEICKELQCGKHTVSRVLKGLTKK